MPKTDGPSIRISASCFNCKHCTTKSYRVQSDSGSDVFCEHPNIGKKHVGDTNWTTPSWCPLFDVAMSKFIEEEKYRKP